MPKKSKALRDNFACKLEISDKRLQFLTSTMQTRFPGEPQCDQTFLVEDRPEERVNPAQYQVLSYK